jgi:hypothetical protein
MQCPTCGYIFQGTPPSCPQCGVSFTYPAQPQQDSQGEPGLLPEDQQAVQQQGFSLASQQPQPSQPQPQPPQSYAPPQSVQPPQGSYQEWSQVPQFPQQQAGYAQASYQAQPSVAPPSAATPSMILGIISLAVLLVSPCLFGFSCLVSLVLSIIGVVLGHKANRERKSGQGTAGVIMNWISIGLSVLMIIAIVALIFFGLSLAGLENYSRNLTF